ncbi:MAG: hypothetical protein ACPIOQ_43785 [Promethearchaeia archaeon]
MMADAAAAPVRMDVGEIRACFEQLPIEVLAQRGRLVADGEWPHHVSSVDGLGCRLLRVGSASRVHGRMLGSIVAAKDRSRMLEAARLVTSCDGVRAYFVVTMLDAGCTAPIAAKAFVTTTGRRFLELLIFPDGAQNEELLRLLGNGLVLDSPLDSLSQIAPGRYASLEEDFSKDVELDPAERISASPQEEEDHVGGLSPLLSIRWRQAPLIPSKAAQRSETDDTRVAHALSPTQETIIPPDLISITVSKGQTGGAQGGRQKGGCRAS